MYNGPDVAYISQIGRAMWVVADNLNRSVMSTQHGQPRAARRIEVRYVFVRRGLSIGARALGVWLAASGAACSDPGEIVLVVQTDMNIDKDIDKVRIEVLTGDGAVALRGEYGTDKGDLKLPGTLGIRSSLNPEQELTIRVSGELDGAVRVVRDVRTTLPGSGVVMLRAPLQWLCDSAECPGQGTCIAGSCASSGITSSTLQPYAAADVFGGGSGSGSGVDGECFDTVQCFSGAKDIVPEKSDLPCSIPGSGGGSFNIALRTEGDGFCGPDGCFIPLDAESDIGWREISGSDGPRIQLPAAVCTHLGGKVLGVATSTKCAAKSERTPTCGAWSQAGKWSAPNPAAPVTLAAGQGHPSSIAIDGNRVYWTNAGTEAANGSVKSVSREGGAPFEIAVGQESPAGVVVDSVDVDVRRAYWINEGTGAVMGARLDAGEPLSLDGLGARANLALHGDNLYFGTVGNLIVQFSPATGSLKILTIEEDKPVYIVAYGMNVYWSFQPSDPNKNGGLKRVPIAGPEPSKIIVSMQQNPLAVTIDDAHIYWVNAGSLSVSDDGSVVQDGSIVKVEHDGDNPQLPGEEKKGIAGNQAVPYAIALHGEHVYWTNVGDGRVMRAPKQGGKAVPLATGQSNPIAVVVDGAGKFVYWANAGTATKNFSDGSIMRVSTY